MSLFFPARPEQRGLSYQDVWGSGGEVAAAIGGPGVVAGGLRLIPVYSATSLIADLVSTAPLRAFREAPDGTRTPLPRQPQLVVNPSPFGTKIDWIHQAMASLLLRGNAFGYITDLDAAGRPARIIWFNPDEVTVVEEQLDWFHRPTYYWRGRPLDPSLVVHIPAYTFPGSVVGFSPLGLFKLQIELGLRAQQHGDDWFRNGANPSGQLKNTGRTIPPEEADKIKKRYKEAIRGRDVFVTGNDWDYKTLSVSPNESQFLETIKANATQVAAIYRVSPEDIGGETGTSLTYKTLAQDSAKLTGRTLQVWCDRMSAALNKILPRPQYVRFDLDRLAQGDKASRLANYKTSLDLGLDTLNEARAQEDKPPLTDEELSNWLAWYRKTTPVDPAPTPAPTPSITGGPNA